MREKERDTVSSNSRFQAALFRLCSANLSASPEPRPEVGRAWADQDSSKGRAVETGCSGYIILYAVLLYNTTPIHCTPLRLHPPLMNTQPRPALERARAR